MPDIRYISKEELFPAFGLAKDGIIYVREDLPNAVKSFVIEHEIYHLQDDSVYWLWREIKANLYAGIKHPIGFIYTVILSLSLTRIKFYIQRFKNKA